MDGDVCDAMHEPLRLARWRVSPPGVDNPEESSFLCDSCMWEHFRHTMRESPDARVSVTMSAIGEM